MVGMHVLCRLFKTRSFRFQDQAWREASGSTHEPCTGGTIAGVSYKNEQPPKPESHVESVRHFLAAHPTIPKRGSRGRVAGRGLQKPTTKAGISRGVSEILFLGAPY